MTPIFLVHVPAIVENEDLAFKALNWSQVLRSLEQEPQSTPIEFTKRRDEPYAHPLFGRCLERPQLILKVKKSFLQNPSIKLAPKIMGLSTRSIFFRELSDYQYIPNLDEFTASFIRSVHAGDVESLKELTAMLATPHLPKDAVAPPPIFAHVSVPYGYKLEPYSSLQVQSKEPSTPYSHKRGNRCPYFYCQIEDNQVPAERPLSIHDVDSDLENKLIALFDDRKIWSFVAINNQFSPSDRPKVRKLLPLYAYYFSNGPWRHCWVKLGYDPRTDPASLFLQVLELRAFFNKYIRKEQNLESSLTSHILDDNINPLTISHLFQLCDIQDDGIQQFLTILRRQRLVFSVKTGWMSASDRDKIVALIKGKWAAALQVIKNYRSNTEFPISFKRPSKNGPRLPAASSSARISSSGSDDDLIDDDDDDDALLNSFMSGDDDDDVFQLLEPDTDDL